MTEQQTKLLKECVSIHKKIRQLFKEIAALRQKEMASCDALLWALRKDGVEPPPKVVGDLIRNELLKENAE